MSEAKKFTTEELSQITKLQETNARKVSEFGQIEIEILLAKQRLENLEIAKQSCQDQYKELQQEEQELVSNLNEKYGVGTVDVNTGEFIPQN
jgi:hypothetical protein